MTLAYIALGANLGDAEATVAAAITALAALPETRLVAVSSLYRTAPVGLKNQPDFINAVIALEVTLAPPAMVLSACAAIGGALGATDCGSSLMAGTV